MTRIFEGKSEKEAIDKAVEELKIGRENFDVEILESNRGGLFRKGYVKIKIHLDDENNEPLPEDIDTDGKAVPVEADEEFESGLKEFLTGMIEKMGYTVQVNLIYREQRKIGLELISDDDSAILIGRKGKNLEAIQLLANVYAGKNNRNVKIVVDCENYRLRHEEQMIRNALHRADQVKRSGKPVLLEPMNPYERRLVHTALNDCGVDTNSEGEGLYKQIKITAK